MYAIHSVATVLLHEGHEGHSHESGSAVPIELFALGIVALAASTAVLYWALYRR